VEKDLRARYLGIEPMHYEVVSCPQCLYSAPVYLFPTVSKRMSAAVMRELQPHRADVELKAGGERDTFTVFAGYYLAVKSAPLCFDEHQTVTAKLWKSLAAIYKDCGDDEMYLYASEKALADYMEAYSRLKLTEEQLQQICYAIGDLNERLGRLEEARQFFFMAKSARGGTNAMRIKADNRLEEVKELLKTR
jgi:uncharacterized protein (DUF2225 family)